MARELESIYQCCLLFGVCLFSTEIERPTQPNFGLPLRCFFAPRTLSDRPHKNELNNSYVHDMRLGTILFSLLTALSAKNDFPLDFEPTKVSIGRAVITWKSLA